MEFRRSIVSGSSSAKSRFHERNISQERQSSFKKPTRLTSCGPERRPELKREQTIVESTDTQQIIKEKICTIIPKGQSFSHEDLSP